MRVVANEYNGLVFAVEVQDGAIINLGQGAEQYADMAAMVSAKPNATIWDANRDQTNWTKNPVRTGDQREHAGKTWVSLIDYNVWEPPIGWREVVEEGHPAWVQPTGAHDAYAIGDRVTHRNAQNGGRVWLFESKIAANVTVPGTDGRFHRWWEPIEVVS